MGFHFWRVNGSPEVFNVRSSPRYITKLIIRGDGLRHLVVRLSKLKEFASNSDAGVVCILRSLAAEAGSSSVSVSELN